MNNDVTPFEFEGHTVRVIDRNGLPWWFLVDVCRVLGLSNPSKVASRLDDDEKHTRNQSEGDKINGLGRTCSMPTHSMSSGSTRRS